MQSSGRWSVRTIPAGRGRYWGAIALLAAVNLAGWWWFGAGGARAEARPKVLSLSPTLPDAGTERLVLRFDRAAVPGQHVDAPLDEAPFELEPACDGVWSFPAADRAELELRDRLVEGRRYRLRATEALETVYDVVLGGERSWTLPTPALEVEPPRLQGVERRFVNVQLRFSQPVSPGALAEAVEAWRTTPEPEAPLVVQVLNREPSRRPIVRVDMPEGERLELRLDGALRGDQRDLPLGEGRVFSLPVSRHFQLLGLRPRVRDLEQELELELRFSEPLDPQQSFAGLSLEPSVPGLRHVVRGSSLALIGDFAIGPEYRLRVAEGLESATGRRLRSDVVHTLRFPDRDPRLALRRSQGILSPRGQGRLDLDLVNVETLEVRASRAYPDEIVSLLRGDGWQHTSREVLETERRIDAPRNQPVSATVDLLELLPEARGVYKLELRSREDRWTSDRCVVVLSDLGLSLHRDRDSLWVWTTSLAEGRAVGGVRVEVRTWSNQLLVAGTSDARGVVQLHLPADHPDGAPALVLARQGEDLASLELFDQPWQLPEAELERGVSWPRGHEAALFTDRGVHRPGETVHLAGLLRDEDGGLPASFPLELRWRRPDGREIAQLLPGASPQGFLVGERRLDATAPTGRWRVSAHLPGDEHALGSTAFLVESYVPARIEVESTLAEAPRPGGTEATIAVAARHLFGAPAEGLKLSASGDFRPRRYRSERWPAHRFEPAATAQPWTMQAEEAVLDAEGRVELALNIPGVGGAWSSEWILSVHERGGRSVSTRQRLDWDPVAAHLGLALEQGGRVVSSQSHRVQWVGVDGEDRPRSPAALSWTLSRVEKTWRQEEWGGRLRWRSEIEHETVEQATIAELAAGEGWIELPALPAGDYRLVVSESEPACSAVLEYRVTAPGEAEDLRVHDRPGRVRLEVVDGPVVAGGEAAVLVRSPFPGTLWACVETDRVVHSEVVEMDSEETWLRFPVDPSWRHGAFVSATVVRGIDPEVERWREHRAYGACRLEIEHPQRQARLAIEAPAEARPGQPLKLSVQLEGLDADADGDAEVLVWAVDEGILDCTDFTTPDPGRRLTAPAARSVQSEDLYDQLLEDHRRPAGTLAIGAGDDFEDALRRSPVPLRAAAPVVLWSELRTLRDGRAELEWMLPEFEGRLRVMAVASAGPRCASAEAPVTVRAPLMAQWTPPRFAAPGDVLELPIELFVDEALAADPALRLGYELSLQGPAEIVDGAQADGLRREGPSTLLRPRLRLRGVGDVELELIAWAETAAGRRETLHREAAFSSRAPGVLHRASRFLRVAEAGELELPRPEGFVSGTTRTRVRVGGDPVVEFEPARRAVVGYPHGCLEQTTSGLFALLVAWESGSVPAGPEGAMPAELLARIQSGLYRLWSMQTDDGGLAYWPGGGRSHAWGSAYAAEFLHHLEAHELAVEAEFREGLLDYLEARLEGRGRGAPDLDEQARLVAVLARLGRERRGRLQHLHGLAEHLEFGGRIALAEAWSTMGRDDAALRLLEGAWRFREGRVWGARLDSPVVQRASLLRTMLALRPDDERVPGLARDLVASAQGGRWGTTLDDAAGLRAVAAYVGDSQGGAFHGSLRIGDRELVFADDRPVDELWAEDESATLRWQGTGPVQVCVETVGLAVDLPAVDQGLELRRSWRDVEGEPVEGPLTVGQLIEVELRARRCEPGPVIRQVALTDLLPAGLEVENPRLSNSAARATTMPERVEFRDDRVVAFVDVGEEEVVVRYWLRAVSAGRFTLPGPAAECMYEPELISRGASAILEVLR